MQVSEFAFRLMLLFLPGILVYTIEDELTHQNERKSYEVIIYSLLYGFLSYFLYFLVLSVVNIWKEPDVPIHLFESIVGTRPDFTEIFYVSILSLFLAFFVVIARTNKWIHRAARRLKITDKSGDVDISL